MRSVITLTLLATLGFACGDDGSGSGSPEGGLPPLSAELDGIFLDEGMQLVIELSSSSIDNDPANVSMGDIDVQLSDGDFVDIPLTMVTVLADGVEVAMVSEGERWVSDYNQAVPYASVYEFEVEAGAGNTVSGLAYRTEVVPPHEITAPGPGSTLGVGTPTEVSWAPSDPALNFQVDLSEQSYDARYTGGDPGSFTLPAEALSASVAEDQLRVGRRAIQTLVGLPASGVRHTHTTRIPVSVQ